MLKRLINLSGSLLVAACDSLRRLVCKVSGVPLPSTCVVLAYHSVTRSQRARFAGQMDVVLETASPVPADVASLPNSRGHFAAVTFDDGLENVIHNAIPELITRNIPATLFIVTDVLGGNPKWEYFGGDDPSQERAMTAEQLASITSDLITIGSHTMTHPVLTTLDKDLQLRELAGSKSRLEHISSKPITLFSFPYGAFDDTAVQSCREAGYSRVFTALPVFAFAENREFVTGRVGVTTEDWPIEFRLKITGAYRWLPYAFKLKRNLISVLKGRK